MSLFASGSEVEIAMEAQKLLENNGVNARVVSVPCMDLFLAQNEKTRASVIGSAPVKIAIEAAIRQGWDAIIGSDGGCVGMNSFVESAPYKKLYEQFGITPQAVADAAQARLSA